MVNSVYSKVYQAADKQVIYISQLIRFARVCSNVSDFDITTETILDC